MFLTDTFLPVVVFSGGAIIGAGLILYAVSFGERKAKKFFNFKIFTAITSGALLTYAGLKCYSFYTGANHLHSIISTGTPGAILSGGLILPLNICVGTYSCMYNVRLLQIILERRDLSLWIIS